MFRQQIGKKSCLRSFGVAGALRELYRTKLLPLEIESKFHEFHSPPLENALFDAKPTILVIGQYSTGKTTFIKYLLEQDYPGARVGPEPTTEDFTIIMHNDVEAIIPGNALSVDSSLPFGQLSEFGNGFLTHLRGSCIANPILEAMTIIDSPGILSNEDQRRNRGYDYNGVIHWFAERADRIILLFDAHKLEISNEHKSVMNTLSSYGDKIRIVLNKADRLNCKQLIRAYGSLMWSLGKVFSKAEITRVFIGNFWNEPIQHDQYRSVLESEEQDLFLDLSSISQRSATQKIHFFIQRARFVKLHALLLAALKGEMPTMFGKGSKKSQLIRHLDQIYREIVSELKIPVTDFPGIKRMKAVLSHYDFSKLPDLKGKLFEAVDEMLAVDIPALTSMARAENKSMSSVPLKGGLFNANERTTNPFQHTLNEGIDYGRCNEEWIVARFRSEFDEAFRLLSPVDGKLNGLAAKPHMLKSKLPLLVLGKIWSLADMDEDGMLDLDEFALASYLIKIKLEGHEIPNHLPPHLIPPSKRRQNDTFEAYPQRLFSHVSSTIHLPPESLTEHDSFNNFTFAA